MTMTNIDLASGRLLEELAESGEEVRVLCAVSGGLDSMCLLHLFSGRGREQGISVIAAHFNHQLRGAESDRDEAFVRDWCSGHAVPFVSGSGDVRGLAASEGLGMEEAARKARYDFLEQARAENGCSFILTAHHADDNAETMLLNLIRGTGLRGLTGIPERRDKILRPFLQVARQTLVEYAKKYAIPYVEDETNFDPDAASRNLIRLQVMPLLQKINPRAVENMGRAAELLAQDERALELETEKLLCAARVEPGREAELPLSACADRAGAVVTRAIRRLLCDVGGHQKDLTASHVAVVCDLLSGRPGREVSLPYHMTARREEAALLIRRTEKEPMEISISVGEKRRFGDWTVELSRERGRWAATLPEEAALSVSVWRREDRMTLPGTRGSRSFKRLCADRGIQPAERDGLPVLRVDGRVAAAPGIGLDMDFALRGEPAAVFVTFHQDIEEK